MIKHLLAIALAVSLTGCAGLAQTAGIPASPSAVTQRTDLDEDIGRLVTLAYTGAARAAALAIETGVVRDPGTIRRIGELDMCAYALVQGVRIAYNSGNASSYSAALREARIAISTLLGAARGITNEPSVNPSQCSAGGGAGGGGSAAVQGAVRHGQAGALHRGSGHRLAGV